MSLEKQEEELDAKWKEGNHQEDTEEQKDTNMQESSKKQLDSNTQESCKLQWEEEYRWKKAQNKLKKAQKNLKRIEEELKREEEELKKAEEDLVHGFKTIFVHYERDIYPIRIRTRWTVLAATAFIVNSVIFEEPSDAEQITLVSIRPEHNSYCLSGYMESELFMDEFKRNDDEDDYIYLQHYRYQHIIGKIVEIPYTSMVAIGGFLGNLLYSGYQDLQNVVTPEKRKKLE